MILSVGAVLGAAAGAFVAVVVALIRARAAGLTPAVPKTWARAVLRPPLPRRAPLGLVEIICCCNALRMGRLFGANSAANVGQPDRVTGP